MSSCVQQNSRAAFIPSVIAAANPGPSCPSRSSGAAPCPCSGPCPCPCPGRAAQSDRGCALPSSPGSALGLSVPAEQPRWVPRSSSGSRVFIYLFPRHWKSPLAPLRGVSSEMPSLPEEWEAWRNPPVGFLHSVVWPWLRALLCAPLPLPQGILFHRIK